MKIDQMMKSMKKDYHTHTHTKVHLLHGNILKLIKNFNYKETVQCIYSIKSNSNDQQQYFQLTCTICN